MDLYHLLWVLLLIFVLGCGAFWIITKFLPDPLRMAALAIVGVGLLLYLLNSAFPGMAHKVF